MLPYTAGDVAADVETGASPEEEEDLTCVFSVVATMANEEMGLDEEDACVADALLSATEVLLGCMSEVDWT